MRWTPTLDDAHAYVTVLWPDAAAPRALEEEVLAYLTWLASLRPLCEEA